MKRFSVVLLLALSINPSSYMFSADKTQNHQKNITSTNEQITSTFLNINNLSSRVTNIGFSDHVGILPAGGLEYPKGSKKTVIYEAGLLWGGYVNGDNQVRVGGSSYRSGLQPGPIMPNGYAPVNNLTDPQWRIYRVRRDIYPGGPDVNLEEDALNELKNTSDLRAQYELDWNEWPAAYGAPFSDMNSNGVYEPDKDIPGVPGSDQTIYFIANDLDQNVTNQLYGTPPLGIEVHVTYWAYSQSGVLASTYFRKYTLINKGYQQNNINKMFFSMWSDPDLGDLNDDLVGTDSTLGLMFAYNGSPIDANYTPLPPPTVGFALIQGPVVPGNSNDRAYFGGRYIYGKKNLTVTGSYWFINGYGAEYNDPPLAAAEGATRFYNLFNGKVGAAGQPYIDNNGNPTRFIFPGDPITGKGWIQRLSFQPLDVRLGLSIGPFNMSPGDTQEVVFSEIICDPEKAPASYLTGISNLKKNAVTANSFYYNSAAVIISCAGVVQVNNPVSLKASILPADGQINNLQWALNKVPAGSNAVISDLSGLNTSFIPDVEGVYEIIITANINGKIVSDLKTINAITNKKPVAVLKSDATEFVSTDSLLLRFDESYDPEGDELNYNLNGPGTFKYTDSGTAYFFPTPGYLGSSEILLYVSDPYSYSTASVKIKVHPKLESTWITHSYFDPLWTSRDNPINGYYFFTEGDSLYVPLLNSIRRYNIGTDGINFQEVLNIGAKGIWSIKNNCLWACINSDASFWGTIGKLSIYNLASGCSPLLTDYLPTFFNITSINHIGTNTYVRDNNNNFYHIDFTNPSNPKIISQIVVNSSLSQIVSNNDQYIYLLDRSEAGSNYFINKLDRNSLNFYSSIPMPFDLANSQIAIHKDRMVIVNSYVDSIYFYSFYPESNLVLLKEMKLSSLFSNPFPYGSGGYSTISFLNKYLKIDRYCSTKLFDIDDLDNIKTAAASYGGSLSYYKYSNHYYLIENTLLLDPNNPYCGINEVSLGYISDVEDNDKGVLAEYKLFQNYPNPFNPTTNFEFEISNSEPRNSGASFVSLKVFDILGREVAILINEYKQPGKYNTVFNGNNLSSGVYFYQLKTGNFMDTKKFILMK